MSIELLKAVFKNFRIIVFHSFSFLLKIKIPHVPRFDITRVICQAEEYTTIALNQIQYQTSKVVLTSGEGEGLFGASQF